MVKTEILFGKNDTAVLSNTKTTTQIKDKGALLPQMTAKQILKLVKPDKGMLVFNTTKGKPQYYNGKEWQLLKTNQHYVGQEFGGGIVFYTDASREHGLIAAPYDQDTAAKWMDTIADITIGASSKALGTGLSNTQKIVSFSPTQINAATICYHLELNGYSDWYLPSLEELMVMYKNLKLKNTGNFAPEIYWTSSETDFNNARIIDFKNGVLVEHNIIKKYNVRAIRNF